jgi:hypothetical protein
MNTLIFLKISGIRQLWGNKSESLERLFTGVPLTLHLQKWANRINVLVCAEREICSVLNSGPNSKFFLRKQD